MPGLLSWMLLSPAVGVAVIVALPRAQVAWVRRVAAVATGVPLLLALVLLVQFRDGTSGFQFEERLPWVRALGISFHVGIDGISLALLVLHALTSYTGVLISYAIRERVKEYYLFFLTLVTGVFGVFLSLDLFFFYFFYELAVIPMYPLIGMWGSGNKMYATMKLTLYLTLGAVVALVGLLAMYIQAGVGTFDLPELLGFLSAAPFPQEFQRWVFPLLALGFGVIAPMWPLHSWSPIGHAAAPSAVSMLHAGVLMKLGSYAIIRLGLGLLPDGAAHWLPWVAALCVMNILYGGYVAMAQGDLKFIIGYSSSSHMGYVLLGIASLSIIGLNGAVLLMFAHGLMTALAFALIGHVYDQTHTRMVADLGGLAARLPFIGACFAIAALASSGLPGFANFVSEFLVFVGACERYRWPAIAAVFGLVVTATYLLRAVRHVFWGPLPARWQSLRDAVTPFERLPYVLLISGLVVVGCWPSVLLQPIDRGVRPVIERLEGGGPLFDPVLERGDVPGEGPGPRAPDGGWATAVPDAPAHLASPSPGHREDPG